MTDHGLLLIAHGTRDPRGAEEMAVLVDHVSARVPGPVGHAWLEDFVTPQGVEATEELLARGAEHLVTLPVLNFAAGHAKTDVPGQLLEIRQANPSLQVHHGRVLGVHPKLLELAVQRIDEVSPKEGREDEVLIVAASGSSDPDSNGEHAKAARTLAEWTGHRWVEQCVAGVTWPKTPDVLARVARAGATRAVVFSWSLLAGLLEKRVWDAVDAAESDTGLTLARAGRFGPDPLVADAIADRYREAIEGDIRANCDACVYRVPTPGKEKWLKLASAGGLAQD